MPSRPQARAGEDLQPRGGRGFEERSTTVCGVPRHWIWMQVAILVFVLAGMVIAITKLA